jgi:hypothetical protein
LSRYGIFSAARPPTGKTWVEKIKTYLSFPVKKVPAHAALLKKW